MLKKQFFFINFDNFINFIKIFINCENGKVVPFQIFVETMISFFSGIVDE